MVGCPGSACTTREDLGTRVARGGSGLKIPHIFGATEERAQEAGKAGRFGLARTTSSAGSLEARRNLGVQTTQFARKPSRLPAFL